MKKEIQLLHLDKVQEILALCAEYQNKSCGTAFFEIIGHVGTFSVDLHPDGWMRRQSPKISISGSLKRDNKRSVKEIDDAISKLRSIIDNTKPFEDRIKDIEEAKMAYKKEQLEELAKELNVKIV